MTRRERLIDFIDSLYCPVAYRDEVALLKKIAAENDYRGIEKKDQNTMHEQSLIIETKGRGSRETYSCFYICRVDVGEVGEEMADIAIFYKDDSCLATPRRVSRKNIKINILDE